MSPSTSGLLFGMPWTTCSLTLVQVAAGNGSLADFLVRIVHEQRLGAAAGESGR